MNGFCSCWARPLGPRVSCILLRAEGKALPLCRQCEQQIVGAIAEFCDSGWPAPAPRRITNVAEAKASLERMKKTLTRVRGRERGRWGR